MSAQGTPTDAPEAPPETPGTPTEGPGAPPDAQETEETHVAEVPASAGSARGLRVPLLMAIGCLTASMLLVLATTAGGITYLVLEKRAAEATTTFHGATYTFEYPVDWTETTSGVEMPDEDQVLELRSSDETKYVTVLDITWPLTIEDACIVVGDNADEQGLGTTQNEVIATRDVAGREALHHRAVATDLDGDFTSSVMDSWCITKPDGVIVFVAQTFSDDSDPVSMPDSKDVLDSWKWTFEEGT